MNASNTYLEKDPENPYTLAFYSQNSGTFDNSIEVVLNFEVADGLTHHMFVANLERIPQNFTVVTGVGEWDGNIPTGGLWKGITSLTMMLILIIS